MLGTAPLLRWHVATPAPEEEVAALVTELEVPHALAALLHHYVRRDNTLTRMLPAR